MLPKSKTHQHKSYRDIHDYIYVFAMKIATSHSILFKHLLLLRFRFCWLLFFTLFGCRCYFIFFYLFLLRNFILLLSLYMYTFFCRVQTLLLFTYCCFYQALFLTVFSVFCVCFSQRVCLHIFGCESWYLYMEPMFTYILFSVCFYFHWAT